MKQTFKAFLTLTLTLTLTLFYSCSSDDDDQPEIVVPAPEPEPEPTPNYTFTPIEGLPDWTVDWSWHDSAPDWQNPDPTLFECRMYVVIKLNAEFRPYFTDSDRMAVLYGDECRGVGIGNVSNWGIVYFPIIVSSDSEVHQNRLTLKYYCDSLKHIFTFPGFEYFVPDRTVGTDWDYDSGFPGINSKYMGNSVKVNLPDSLPFNVRDNDIIGAFVGDECRGTSKSNEWMWIFTLIDKEETVSFRYFSEEKQGFYTLPLTIVMDGNYDKEITLNF